MNLAASTAEQWFLLLEQRALLELLEAQVELNRTFLELARLRWGNSLGAGVDVLQQQEQLLRLEAQRPLFKSRVRSLENQLRLLTGQGPGSLETPVRFKALSPVPKVGLPLEIIRQRPDIQAAEQQLIAADHRVAAALAQRYPAIRLTGSMGYQAEDLGDLLDRWIWNLVGSLSASLFDGGRRAAEVERSRALLQERALAFKEKALIALKEISNALASEAGERAHLKLLESELEVARLLLGETQARYTEGLSDYLPVLTALRALQQLEQSRLTVQRRIISQRIQLHRALGGDWAQILEKR